MLASFCFVFVFLDHVVESNVNVNVPGNCLCSVTDALEARLVFWGHNNQIIRSLLSFLRPLSFFIAKMIIKSQSSSFHFQKNSPIHLFFPVFQNIPKKEWCSFFTSKSVHQGCFQNEGIYFNMDYAAAIVCLKNHIHINIRTTNIKIAHPFLKYLPQVTNISI